jgi:hypothetical protein
MKRRVTLSAAFVLLVFILSGCGNSGAFIASNSTEVQLREANYEIVALNMTGEAETSYVFGASVSWGPATNSYGLIPIGNSAEVSLYRDAQTQLWDNIKTKLGEVENRQLALVNVHYDASTANFFFYTWAKLTVVADVVEFK